jgi:hypothetical protein
MGFLLPEICRPSWPFDQFASCRLWHILLHGAFGDGVRNVTCRQSRGDFRGSGAIGCAVAQVMAREGAHVFLGARSQQNLDQAASRIRASGGSADTFIIDVLDEQSTAEQVMQCKQGLIPGKYSPQKRSQWG